MALYNRLTAPARCPRCGARRTITFECDFGDCREMIDLVPGDRYPWFTEPAPDEPGSGGTTSGGDSPALRQWRLATRAGGRPEGGNIDGSAWAVCPSCDYDHHATVRVRADLVTDVVPDRSVFPSSFDASLTGGALLPCARCGRPREMDVLLYAGCSRPAHRPRLGDRYEPLGQPDVTATLWAQALCEEMHEAVALVVLRAGVIAEVLPTDIDRWVRPSDRGRALAAGPMFLE